MKDELIKLLHDETANASAVHTHVRHMEAADLAEVFRGLDKNKAIRLFRLLPKNVASDVFVELDNDQKQDIIHTFTDKEQAQLINDLFADDAADLIEEMPANVVKRLLNNATPETRENINHLLKYHDGSAGSVMTVEYIRLREDNTVKEAFDIIKTHGQEKRVVYTCYVTDNTKTLLGFVSVKDLLVANPTTKIAEIMTRSIIHVHTTSTRKEVADMFEKYGYFAMPVLDSENKLVGVITVDDVLQVIKEQHTETIAKLGAYTPAEHPYLKTSVLMHSRNRIVWLMLLMVSATFTGFVISGFEDALVMVPMLMAFVPMLMDTGGNAGSQASTQIIRSMALGEITPRHTLIVLWKETRVALICGIVLGGVNFVRIIAQYGVGEVYGFRVLDVGLVVTLALCLTVLIAKTLGCLLPIIAKRLRMDPALMAAPLITTIVDTFSLLIYFGIATLLLHI